MTVSLLTPTSLPVTALFQLWSQALSCSSALLARLRVTGEWAAYRLKSAAGGGLQTLMLSTEPRVGKQSLDLFIRLLFLFRTATILDWETESDPFSTLVRKKSQPFWGERGLCHASAIIMMAGGTENSGPSPKGSGQGWGGGWDRSFSTTSEALPRLPRETACSLQSRAGCGQERPSACVGLVGAGESEGL